MDKIIAICNSNTVSTLLGVLIGFFLSLGYEWVKEFRKKKKIGIALLKELHSIMYQIAEKKRSVSESISALEGGAFLNVKSIPVNCTVYRSNIEDLSSEMDMLNLNCLYAIYERIHLAEETLNSFKEDFFEIHRMKGKNPFLYGKTILGDVLVSYDVTIMLIASFLAKKPTDVFYIRPKAIEK